jgi:tetratricopeptide (TPR) repeat protein
MAITPDLINSILVRDADSAAEVLTRLLVSDECGLADLAQLGAYLVPRGRYDLAEKVFARWTASVPNNPEPWTNLGLCLSRQKKMIEAKSALEHALALNPDYLPAMNNLAEVYQELGEHDLQLKNCLRAVQKYPNSALAFNNLGSALVDQGMFDEAQHAFETCLLLDDKSFEARFNLAQLASRMGQTQLAIEHLVSAKHQSQNKNQRQLDVLDFQLGIEYLTCGRIDEGFELYEKGFSSAIPSSLARRPQRQFSVPTWNGQSLGPNERLMIWREQGVGDEIRFASLISLLPESILESLIIECDHRLVAIFQRSMPGVTVRAEDKANSQIDYDYQLPIGSLPRFLMKSIDVLSDSPPLLNPDPVEINRFATRLQEFNGKKLIGICWRSHKLSAKRNKKYTALEDWRSVLSLPDVVFVNLQYGECEQEMQQVEQELGIHIQRWQDLDLMNDFSSIAGLIKNLDLVISVSSAVVPLAGALGVSTICMCHQNWALLGQQAIDPWFPSVTPIVVPHNDAIATALAYAKDSI